MGTETIIVARTDSEAATLIDTNIDPRDQPFILGTTNKSLPSLNQVHFDIFLFLSLSYSLCL